MPALTCLEPFVKVVGIHSRTLANAQRTGEVWGVEAVEDLKSIRPGDVDMVLISVTSTNNLAVLRASAHLAPGASLVMDTPGIGRLSDLTHLAEYRRWSQVRVAEDFMNLPQYRMITELIESGSLGDISHLSLTKMGYRYHALALLRSWLGFRLPHSARSRRATDGSVDIKYRFAGGVVGDVDEPYEQAKGAFLITGTKGCLVGHPMGYAPDDIPPLPGLKSGDSRPQGRLMRVEGKDGLSGFEIIGLDVPVATTVVTLPRLRAMRLEDDSEFNLLRVDGLCQVISSLWASDSINARYRIEDAMADMVVSFASRRSRWLPIPQTATRGPVDLVDTVVDRLAGTAA